MNNIVESPFGKHFPSQEARVLAYVRYYQYLNVADNGKTGLITIAQLSEKTRLSQKKVFEIAELCYGININIALANGNAMADLPLAEYTLEDLNYSAGN